MTNWYWQQMHGDQDDSHLSTSAWAHRHRNKRHLVLKFPCLTCHSKPGQHCRTYEGLCSFGSNRTYSHIYRWNQLRNTLEEE